MAMPPGNRVKQALGQALREGFWILLQATGAKFSAAICTDGRDPLVHWSRLPTLPHGPLDACNSDMK